MRKSISIIVLLLIAAAGAFAQEKSLSAGGGIYLEAGIPMWEDAGGFIAGAGTFGFFDFTYAEVNVGFGGSGNTDTEIYGANFNFGLLLKYPFAAGRLSLFPLLGARLLIPLNQSYDGEKIDGFKVKDNIRLGAQGGFGMDIPLGRSSFYLRTSLLCNVDFFAPGKDPGDDTVYSVGPMIKIGAGYKFK